MNYFFAHSFLFISVAFGVALLAITWLVLNLYRRWNAVFGKRVRSQDDVLRDALRRTTQVEERLSAIEPRLRTLETIGSIAIQKIGFMRFNPFEHTGGDQSFAIALLDREDNGIILSSLYAREGVRVYAKEVHRGTSKHPLSDEEQRVLEQALKK